MKNNNTTVENIKDGSEDLMHEVKNKILEEGSAIKDKAITAGKVAVYNMSNLTDEITEWVKTNPAKSIGIAFLAGWLISKKV
jgi:ElaB/YqjD/DUF883 family membrane-anchored ribosome-binding protein